MRRASTPPTAGIDEGPMRGGIFGRQTAARRDAGAASIAARPMTISRPYPRVVRQRRATVQLRGTAFCYHHPMPSPRRFPPPLSIEERQESFIVKDASGQQLAYLYFEDEPQRQMSMKRLSRDEAFLIAVNIAKLSSVPRQILKDIPWPPN